MSSSLLKRKIKQMNSNLKAKILEKQLDYFKVIFKDLRIKNDSKAIRNVLNHFRSEKNASISIYKVGPRWRFHDFGDPTYSGDVFDLFALVNDLNIETNFKEILLGLANELNIDCSPIDSQDTLFFELGIKPFAEINKHEKNWLIKYKISESTMESLDFHFLKYYIFYSKNKRKKIRINSIDDNIIIAHQFEDCAKIYQPNSQKFKFQFLGIKPPDYFIGLNQIENLLHI